MKLIIDIPKSAYDTIQGTKHLPHDSESTLENVLIMAVENSKPFYDELQEMEDEIETTVLDTLLGGVDDCFDVHKIYKCLEIINKHRGELEESGDKG